jgi:hypothetical protein
MKTKTSKKLILGKIKVAKLSAGIQETANARPTTIAMKCSAMGCPSIMAC